MRRKRTSSDRSSHCLRYSGRGLGAVQGPSGAGVSTVLSLLQWRVTGYFGILATREHAAAQLSLALVALAAFAEVRAKVQTNIIKLKLNTDKLIKLTLY